MRGHAHVREEKRDFRTELRTKNLKNRTKNKKTSGCFPGHTGMFLDRHGHIPFPVCGPDSGCLWLTDRMTEKGQCSPREGQKRDINIRRKEIFYPVLPFTSFTENASREDDMPGYSTERAAGTHPERFLLQTVKGVKG